MTNVVLGLFSAIGHEYSCNEMLPIVERVLIAVMTVPIFGWGGRGVLKGFLRID
jgi:hypothetical protein